MAHIISERGTKEGRRKRLRRRKSRKKQKKEEPKKEEEEKKPEMMQMISTALPYWPYLTTYYPVKKPYKPDKNG